MAGRKAPGNNVPTIMTPFEDEQRLAFGRVAALYDRARPSYPRPVIDDVIDHTGLEPPARILEVGAGTGKATVLFADRGLGVLALEPSHEMALRARVNCARYPEVEVVEAAFERWQPNRRFPALISVQAWHWIEPGLRYTLAGEALAPGATLAAIWTFPDWQQCGLRRSLSQAYRAAAPRLTADFPMHPDSEPTTLAGDWGSEIEGSPGFARPEVKVYPWSHRYTSAEYIALLQTHQDHILLPTVDREDLLTAIARAVDDNGGTLVMPFVTHLCLATRL